MFYRFCINILFCKLLLLMRHVNLGQIRELKVNSTPKLVLVFYRIRIRHSGRIRSIKKINNHSEGELPLMRLVNLGRIRELNGNLTPKLVLLSYWIRIRLSGRIRSYKNINNYSEGELQMDGSIFMFYRLRLWFLMTNIFLHIGNILTLRINLQKRLLIILVMYASCFLGPDCERAARAEHRDQQRAAMDTSRSALLEPTPDTAQQDLAAPLDRLAAGDDMSDTPDTDTDQVKDHALNINVLSQNYYQCRAGRDATFKDDSIECCNGPELGYMVGGEAARIGSFESDVKSIENCFVGSRIYRDGVLVNQNMSCSFDPSTLTCLTCDNNHTVLPDSPACFCISDQNFVGNLSGGGGGERLCGSG